MDEFTATTTAAPDRPAASIAAAHGSMTIEYGQSIKAVPLEALEKSALATPSPTVVLDLTGLSATDVIGLQLVCSMHRSATDQGPRLLVRGSENEVVPSVKEAAGYHGRSRCSGGPEGSCILCAATSEVSP